MVRLLLKLARIRRTTPERRFNPTMVRLLPGGVGIDEISEGRFQSHNGAIAANLQFAQVWGERWFQSHNGAIAASPK